MCVQCNAWVSDVCRAVCVARRLPVLYPFYSASSLDPCLPLLKQWQKISHCLRAGLIIFLLTQAVQRQLLTICFALFFVIMKYLCQKVVHKIFFYFSGLLRKYSLNFDLRLNTWKISIFQERTYKQGNTQKLPRNLEENENVVSSWIHWWALAQQ